MTKTVLAVTISAAFAFSVSAETSAQPGENVDLKSLPGSVQQSSRPNQPSRIWLPEAAFNGLTNCRGALGVIAKNTTANPRISFFRHLICPGGQLALRMTPKKRKEPGGRKFSYSMIRLF